MRALKKLSPLDFYISKKLKQFRQEIGMSLEELAERSGLSYQQIQKYESAKNKISASKLFEFAQILQKPVNDFYEEFENVEGKYYPYQLVSQKHQRFKKKESKQVILPLIRAFNRIENKQIKKHILNLVKEISGPVYRKRTKHSYN